MIVKITSKRQVTFPADVLEIMGVGPGDRLELTEVPDGFLIKPKRIDPTKLAPLHHLISPDTPPFDIAKFRDGTYDASLRD